MNLVTKRFGAIEIGEDSIIHFRNGIPGFEDLSKFILVQESVEHPFAYMQSVDDGGVSFIIVNPFAYVADYEFDLGDAVLAELDINTEADVQVWVIMTIVDSVETATLNLLAPIIINHNSKLGKQVILHDSEYLTKHPLLLMGG